MDEPKAVLSQRPRQGRSDLLRAPPPPALAEYVEHFWSVRWDFRGAPPFLAHTLPHPVVHITFERGKGEILGLSKKPFRRELTGCDRVFAVKFRPAGFSSFIDQPMSALTGKRLSFARQFGARGLTRELLSSDDFERNVSLLSAFLEARLKPLSPKALEMRDLVERLQQDRSIVRVEDLRMNRRALQRGFARYIGLPPKWVIGRYRLHEAAARLKSGEVSDLAALAQELGYFDQAHFIHDFRAHVGEPPGQFLKRCRAQQPERP